MPAPSVENANEKNDMNLQKTAFARAAGYILSFVLFVLDPAAWAEEPVRIAVFQGDGVGPSAEDLLSVLENTGSTELVVSRISAEEIRAGELSEFDVLIHPGGSGSKQGKALGESGREAVTQFVRDGGGYLGVCGGAYLTTRSGTVRCGNRIHGCCPPPATKCSSLGACWITASQSITDSGGGSLTRTASSFLRNTEVWGAE
jgi:putative intracellular protease/amidase